MGAAPTASRPPSVAYPRTVTMPSIPITGQRAKDPYGLGGTPNAPVSRPYVPPEPSGGGVQEWKAVGGTGSTVSLDAGVPSVAPAAPARSSSDGGEAVLREALSKASREVIERIAWEVVPQLAETIIREQLERLIKERDSKS